jgi:nitrite reductase/ring-hydroxylating ferredoxin subunit
VNAAGIPVLLVKQEERIYAIGEVCSHLGGPLSEGTIANGVVTCPWHGSQFALTDGAVVNGPATFAQPCFQTRVRNGKVEVGPRCVAAATAAAVNPGAQPSATPTGPAITGARP